MSALPEKIFVFAASIMTPVASKRSIAELTTDSRAARPEAQSFEPAAATPNAARRPSITVLIPRGEVMRNFLHTGALDLISRDAELSLITVSPNDETISNLKARFPRVEPLVEIEERWPVRIQREIIEMAHGRHLWSRAARERWRLRDSEAITPRDKAVRFSKKLACLPFANRSGLKALTAAERLTSRALRTTDHYTRIYEKTRPDLVFNGSHIHSRNATQAVQAAQWLGIPTATFIFSWDNLTSQGRIMLPYDYFLVWNEKLKQQLLEIYEWILPENVFVTGTPQFDFHFRPEYQLSRDEYCAEIGADPSRPIVFYSTGMANHMPGEPEIVEAIADALKRIDTTAPPQLLVRVYPKDLTGRFDDLRSRRSDILFPAVAWDADWLTPRAEDASALVGALRHCAVGINVASTVSLELCMFDKPVINVGYNPPYISEQVLAYSDYYEFDHYKPVVESGAVQVARSERELIEMIRENLAEPDTRASERRRLIDEMFGPLLDGKSAYRAADVLIRLAAREKATQ